MSVLWLLFAVGSHGLSGYYRAGALLAYLLLRFRRVVLTTFGYNDFSNFFSAKSALGLALLVFGIRFRADEAGGPHRSKNPNTTLSKKTTNRGWSDPSTSQKPCETRRFLFSASLFPPFLFSFLPFLPSS
jgi:hypothetical protein